jgi:putative ABC transport system permease protein
MAIWRRLQSWLSWFPWYRRQARESDLERELHDHLELEADEQRASGLSPEEAAHAAHRALGNTVKIEEDVRAAWGIQWLEALAQDLRYGVRTLRKSPGFAAIAILTLALGIGATAATYSVTYATLIEPLPYPDPDRLVMVWPQFHHRRVWGVSAGDFLDWKRQNTVFSDLNAAMLPGPSFNLATASRPEYVTAQAVTPGYYDMMGVRPMLGRRFLPEEGTLGKDHVVFLTYRFWKKLGADRNIIGKSLRMNGELYTVVGVAEPGPLDRIQFDLVIPLVFKPEQINHAYHWLMVMGRLKAGVSLAEANAEMSVIARRIAQDHPDTNKGFEVSVEPLQNDFLPKETKTTLWLLLGAVAFVLCVACVNVASLLLARSTVRQKEVALRISLGASRSRVFVQLLTESLILAVLGGAAGVALAAGLVKVIVSLLPKFMLPSEADVRLSIPVLLFALLVSVSAGVLFGCAPAWQGSGIDPNRALKDGGASGMGHSRRRLREALVVMEFALALPLLAGAGLAIRSFWNLTRVDLGTRTDHILTFTVPVPDDRLRRPEQMVAFYRHLLERMKSVPGVSTAVAATGLPVLGARSGVQFQIAGTPLLDARSRPNAEFQSVTPGYFEAFGIPILKGRSFNERDIAGSVPVAMVNESFVRRYLANVDPLAQRIITEMRLPGRQMQRHTVELQVVGVFRNVSNDGLRNQDYPEIDVPFWQSPWPQAEMAVRTATDPTALTRSIEDVVSSVESDLPLANVRSMSEIVDTSLAGDRFSTVLYGSFAALAVLLAAVGIYGVLAFAVAQRTHEIGIRMALGAGRGNVLRLMLGQGGKMALLGVAIGVIASLALTRVMASMLFGVNAQDPVTFVGVALLLIIVGLVACYIPARRATQVDPMVALRYE